MFWTQSYGMNNMSVSIDDFDLRSAIEFDKKILSFAGLYPVKKHAATLIRTARAVVTVSLMNVAILSMLAQIVVHRNNIRIISETLLVLLAELTYFGKVVNLAFYGQGVLDLERQLTNSLFYGFPRDQLAGLQRRIKICAAIAFVFISAAGMCWVFFGLVMLFDRSKTMKMAFPGWTPYDARKHYYPTTVFQSVAFISSAVNNTTIDALIWMFITLGTAQFDLLKEKMKNIDFGSRQSKKEELKNCIEHHNAIVELVSHIETTFSKCIFIQFLASGSIICFTCFQFLFIPILSSNFVHLFLFLFVMVSQIAMYCWYGHEIITTSSEIGTFLYMSDWYKSDAESRKLMLILMERSKRPMMLTAGNLIVLSLVTLSAIFRSSYSFLAVLRHYYQNK